MKEIRLDSAKLLGFRLEGPGRVRNGGKTGQKIGAKIGAKHPPRGEA